MFTGAFAMLNRALRVEDRLLRSHVFRLFFVGTIYVALLGTQSMSFMFGAPGLRFFSQICYMNFMFITLAGFSFFSSAITEEKEEQTLGLLRMAGISPVGMLLGKSTPRLVTASLLLAAQFPFTILAITLGGVSVVQVLLAYATLLAYLIAVGNLGLLGSVISRTSGGAGWFTGIWLGAFFFAPTVVGAAVAGAVRSGRIAADGWLATTVPIWMGYLRDASPFTQIGIITSTGFGGSIQSSQIVSNIVAGAAFFLLAWLVFDRCTRNERPAAPARGLLFRRMTGLGRLGPRRAWANALAWKDFHFVTGGKMMVIIKLILYGIMFAAIYWLSNYVDPNASFTLEDLGEAMMGGMIFATVVETALYTSRLFSTELKWNTLPGLMILPKSIPAIAYSKIVGCLLALIPALTYFCLGIALSPDSFADMIDNILNSGVEDFGVFFMLCSIFLFFIHLTALLSLFVKWGALPLALAITYVAGMLMFPLFFLLFGARGPGEEFAYIVALMALIATGSMHFGIGARLRALGSR